MSLNLGRFALGNAPATSKILILSEGDRRSSEGRVDVGIIQLSNDDKKDDDKKDDDKEDDDKEDDNKEDDDKEDDDKEYADKEDDDVHQLITEQRRRMKS